MKTYVIEREIPNAGKLTQEQLQGIAKTSNTALAEMSKDIKWLHSYVAENKVYCIYEADRKELLYEHAQKGKFPINNVTELNTIINPDTSG